MRIEAEACSLVNASIALAMQSDVGQDLGEKARTPSASSVRRAAERAEVRPTLEE